jgi:hypothetical protein
LVELVPFLVHLSLIIILDYLGAFKNFKAQVLPKGELFHIQNTIGVGWVTLFPITTRVNDFLEYENNRIHQFYSNLSILDAYGKEVKIKQSL